MLKRPFNKGSLYTYLFLFALSIYPILFTTVIDIKEDFNKKELFNSELSQLKTVDDMIVYIDGIYAAKFSLNETDTIAYVNSVSDVVKKRFYHGLSIYSMNDNWIAFIAGKLCWSHLNAIVEPNDILNFSEGLCSQQVIVFLEILKRKGIQTRWVGLGHKENVGHFLAEVFYQGTWHLYDVNLEPKWDKITEQHQSMHYYTLNPDTLYKVYEGILDKKMYDKLMEKVKYGAVNEFPAKNMLLFHRITKIIIYLIPLFLGVLIVFTLYKQKVPAKLIKKAASKFKVKDLD